MHQKNSHCSYCGHSYEPDQEWPLVCANCQNITFRNPTPVAVVIQPVGDQVLLIRRAIEPYIGKWALPGGYVDFGESWQEAAARELWEETGIETASQSMKLVAVHKGWHGATMLVFAEAPPIKPADVSLDATNSEVSEMMLCPPDQLTGVDFAFPLHREVVEEWIRGNILSKRGAMRQKRPSDH
ncbi:MAG: NUDIX domain-containing protein [Chloroflexota bacterium]